MRKAMFGTLAVLTTAVLLGCGNGVTPGPNGNDDDFVNDNDDDGPPAGVIFMQDDFFEPQVDTVTVNTTVTWENQGNVDHTSTSDDEFWDSGSVSSGEDTFHTFSEEGEFPYHCEFHGAPGSGMHGTVVVIEE